MIEYMSRGRFDVDPSSIGFEGFVRDGRTYAYFGVLPALLRWPLLIWPRFAGVDFTALSCAIAATLAAIAKLVRDGYFTGSFVIPERIDETTSSAI